MLTAPTLIYFILLYTSYIYNQTIVTKLINCMKNETGFNKFSILIIINLVRLIGLELACQTFKENWSKQQDILVNTDDQLYSENVLFNPFKTLVCM